MFDIFKWHNWLRDFPSYFFSSITRQVKCSQVFCDVDKARLLQRQEVKRWRRQRGISGRDVLAQFVPVGKKLVLPQYDLKKKVSFFLLLLSCSSGKWVSSFCCSLFWSSSVGSKWMKLSLLHFIRRPQIKDEDKLSRLSKPDSKHQLTLSSFPFTWSVQWTSDNMAFPNTTIVYYVALIAFVYQLNIA